MRIGLVSDTHGLLRPQACAFLRGCDHIIHGGDIGGPDILAALSALAPLTAVRGNNDRGDWAASLPVAARVEVGAVVLHVLHDLADLDIDPAAAGVDIVVCGHSHKPRIREQAGVLYVNPGSAGPRRFKLPVGIAEVLVRGDAITPRLVELPVAG